MIPWLRPHSILNVKVTDACANIPHCLISTNQQLSVRCVTYNSYMREMYIYHWSLWIFRWYLEIKS